MSPNKDGKVVFIKVRNLLTQQSIKFMSMALSRSNMKRTSIAVLIVCYCIAAIADVSGHTATQQDRCTTDI